MCWTSEQWERHCAGLDMPSPEELERSRRMGRVLSLLRKLKTMPGTNMDLKDEMHSKLITERDALHAQRPRR